MRTRERNNPALQEALRAAYLEREKAEAGDQWRSRVMGRIREIGPAAAAPGFWESLEHMVWRLVPVTCLLIAVLGILFVSMDVGHPYDVFDVFLRKWDEQTLADISGFRVWS
ncbi:MAG: hypothetical protein JW821_00500 [Deltaproteobacteria bacterium]|nr:hypothetical protein [Deltaproteobacteria bacterium]